MLSTRVLTFSLLSTLLLLHPALLTLASHIQHTEQARTLTITSKDNQHSFTLHVSASGRTGQVEVRNNSGTLMEALACPLLRDAGSPSEQEIKAAAGAFVASFQTEDLDFDGYMDLKGPREFGAKWTRYCVWFYDPSSHTFSGAYKQRPLAEQMDLLYNLHADPERRRIISYSIGPVDPMQDEYRLENVSKDRPYWPRLIPVQSCLIQSDAGGKSAVIITQYEGRNPVVTRKELPPGDKRSTTELCER